MATTEHALHVAARPETVFSYFTDPVRFQRWMGSEVTLDPRPGGVCRVAFRPSPEAVERFASTFGGLVPPSAEAAPESVVMMGEFVEVDPPRRLVLTWGFEQNLFEVPPQSTEVEISLTPEGDGTILRLSHRRLPPASEGFHRDGWEHYLPRLATAATGGDPGPDPRTSS